MKEAMLGAPTVRPQAPVVLIVEDEEPIALALELIVEDAGYVPVTAPDGRRALELAREHWPSLILTDLMMPRMDGRRFVEALRAQAEEDGMPLPPIVVMTATDPTYTAGMGAAAVLAKPFDVGQVEAILRRHIEAADSAAS